MNSARTYGIFGRPFLELEDLVGDVELDAIDDEITRGLMRVESTATGGTLKWMGVVAPWVMDDGYVDAMAAIEDFSQAELDELIALGDDEPLDEGEPRRFGDETERPFTRAQIRWLTLRHGVYFPWKVCYHLLENDRWDDKHSGAGKDFLPEALEVFPKTVELVKSLPFTEIGRVVIFGLEANDHAPLHRDTEPGRSLGVAQCISIDPRGTKRFYLANAEDAEPLVVDKRVYWFNDMDYHGVLPDPFFRYSLRVDGVFEPSFLRDLERRAVKLGRR
ncbi:MAG: hypothetical protein U0271_26815 [Polyangiaceae bacterium]